MPLYQLKYINVNQAYLIWHIQELEKELLTQLRPMPTEIEKFNSYRHPKKRLEWLATRLAYQILCKKMNLSYSPILKEATGRPYLANGKGYISLSHCFPFVVAAISQDMPIGIDIQVVKPALESARIQTFFLNNAEIKDSSQDVEKLCIYWCIKEAIYKVHGQKGLSLQAINIEPFEKRNQGTVYAQILDKYNYHVYYCTTSEYALAWCCIDKETSIPKNF